MIGIQRVEWPKPQSKGATKMRGLWLKLAGFLLFFKKFAIFIGENSLIWCYELLNRLGYSLIALSNFLTINNRNILMKNVNRALLILLIILSVLAMSCSASRKSKCGCPSKTGMVGY